MTENKVSYLSPQQESLWMTEQTTSNGAYNLPLLFTFDKNAKLKLIEKSVYKVFNDCDVLHIFFDSDKNGDPIQKINDTDNINIDYQDISTFSESDQKHKIEKDASIPFNLNKDKLLIRAKIYFRENNKISLLIVIHHSICDGWGLSLISNALSNAYNGKPIDNKNNYFEYINKENNKIHSNAFDKKITFWKKYLDNVPEFMDYITDYRRKSHNNYKGERLYFKINNNISKKVEEYAKKMNVTPYVVYYSIFEILIYKYSKQSDFIIGTPIANRMDSQYINTLGYFANIVPLRNKIDDNINFENLINKNRKNILNAFSNSSYPISKIVEKINPSRKAGFNPLFQTIFVYQNSINLNSKFNSTNVDINDVNTHTSKFDLNFTIMPNSHGLSFLEYNSELFNKATISSMVKVYLHLLNEALEQTDKYIGNFQLLSSVDGKQYINLAEQGKLDINVNKNIVDIFEENVHKNPDKIAVKYEDKILTYDDLNKLSNKLARYLLKMNLKKETKIGVFLNRSINVVISLLAILKAGAAYVPIDPEYPDDRIRYIIDNSKSPVVITENKLLNNLQDDKIVKINLNTIKLSEESDKNINIPISPSNLAYVIYTSGSTGKPKGVLIEHKNVIRLIKSAEHLFDFKNSDIWTMFHSYAFDYSVWEIWGSLLTNAKLIIVPYLITRSPEDFYNLLIKEQVTILSQTPSSFKELRMLDNKKHGNLKLRYIVSGGETLDISDLKDWFLNHPDNKIKIINMYGITETTVHASFRRIKKTDVNLSNNSVIGRPLPDLSIYILDKNMKPVPNGFTGEMYVSGQGVARGYLNLPSKTKKAFINNPFHKDKYKVYKSGDLARLNSNNELEYVGRADKQVKIRGFRVELGEIESVIAKNHFVSNVVVNVVKISNVNTLVAYLVINNNFNLRLLKNDIKKELPDYMIPSYFIPLKDIPVTTNGKVNKKKLPLPNEYNVITTSNHEVPKNNTESVLLKIWKNILGINDIGVTDDFFELGGHSLLAVKLTSLIKSKFNRDLPISVLFNNSTIRDLANIIDKKDIQDLNNPLIQINSNDANNSSLFLIHPAMGQVMCFKELSKHIYKHVNVFAIRAPGLYGERKPFNNIELMAQFYMKLIKSKQNKGPYNLAGYCVGGAIASEIAHQLRANGDSVNFLGLFDTALPKAYNDLSKGFIVSFFVEQFFKSFDAVNETSKKNINCFSAKELNLKDWSYKDYVIYMLNIVKKLGIVNKDYSFKNMSDWYQTWKNTILGMNKYRAKTIDVPITLYHAVNGTCVKNEWDNYSTKIVRNINISGDHYTLLKEPNVKEIATDILSQIKN